jgi:hypothetical protein
MILPFYLFSPWFVWEFMGFEGGGNKKTALREGGLFGSTCSAFFSAAVFIHSSKANAPDLLDEKWAADDGSGEVHSA